MADVALGLTVYLAEPMVWAREGAASMLASFARVARGAGVRWWTTSRVGRWRQLDAGGAGTLGAELALPASVARPRHLLQFRWADDVTAPGAAFTYLEVDDARQDRTGVLELLLPQDSDPDALLALATEIGERWPIWSAVGGYVATFFPDEKPTSFELIYRWCLRYLGLDAQDPLAMSWLARNGLPGTGWLTLIGAPLVRALGIDDAALKRRTWHEDVRVHALANGLLVQAGRAPTLGDVNRLTLPFAYAEVARALAPHFVETPPAFLGRFARDGGTDAWFRRFIEWDDWSRR